MITSLIPSFNGGEMSPLIHLRSDLEKYRAGCRTLENFQIIPFGGVKRRSGFAYVATGITKFRLFRFQVSSDLGYILEFGEEYIRFYQAASPVQKDGDDYLVDTPYQLADLEGLQIVQINNIAYFTHPDYPVHKLTRFSGNSWSFEPVEFSYPAMMDENLNENRTLSPKTSGEIGETVEVNSNFDFFGENDLGAYYQISHERKGNNYYVNLKATAGNDGAFSDPVKVQGAWNFTTSGIWDGRYAIQRSKDDGVTWEELRVFVSDEDENYSAGGEEKNLVKMRIGYKHGSTGTNGNARLEASGQFLRGLVKVTDVVGPRRVNAEVIEPVQKGATSYWREGAWSKRRGYPRTAVSHEQRMVYGGTRYRPQSIWASVVDDYENFKPGGTNADDSWNHVIYSDQQNSIQWMISQKSLLVGTSGDEWVLGASDEETIITPTSVRARRHSGNGSTFMRARLVNDSVIYVQRGGRRARDMSFDFSRDGYISTDLTLLAEHVTGLGIIDTALQTHPESRLWCVTGGGELIVLSYDRAQAITGWQRMTTGKGSDGFESVAIKSTSGEFDQVWVSVRRTIDGTVRRYVERITEDGDFRETPWSELYADISNMPVWGIGDTDYALNDVVYDSRPEFPYPPHSPYVCIEAYNTEDDNGVPESNIDKWVAAIVMPALAQGFFEGTFAVVDGKLYVANQDVMYDPAIPATAPGTDAGIYWDFVRDFGTPDTWYPLNAYEAGDFVSKDGKPYLCLISHTSTEATPGESPTYWELQQGSYVVGDLVSVDYVNYRCTANNTPDPDTNKPGYGSDWDDFWEIIEFTPKRFYVDSGVLQTDLGEITEFSGLSHLEGETVQILANGYTLSDRVVTDGKILFNQESDPESFTSLSVGLKYASVLEPMALEVGLQNGTSVSREKRIHDLAIFFHDSGACQTSSKKTGPFEIIPFRRGDNPGDNAQQLFTGAIEHRLEARHELEASFVIKSDLPLPLTVLAIVPKWNVFGDEV